MCGLDYLLALPCYVALRRSGVLKVFVHRLQLVRPQRMHRSVFTPFQRFDTKYCGLRCQHWHR